MPATQDLDTTRQDDRERKEANFTALSKLIQQEQVGAQHAYAFLIRRDVFFLWSGLWRRCAGGRACRCCGRECAQLLVHSGGEQYVEASAGLGCGALHRASG